MIEAITKISGIFKASIVPLFFLGLTHTTYKDQVKEERPFKVDDQVPGDNFPHIVMPQKF